MVRTFRSYLVQREGDACRDEEWDIFVRRVLSSLGDIARSSKFGTNSASCQDKPNENVFDELCSRNG